MQKEKERKKQTRLPLNDALDQFPSNLYMRMRHQLIFIHRITQSSY